MTIAAAANLNFFSLLNAALLNIVVDTGSARMPTNVGCRSVRSSDVFCATSAASIRDPEGPDYNCCRLVCPCPWTTSMNRMWSPTWPRYGHIVLCAFWGLQHYWHFRLSHVLSRVWFLRMTSTLSSKLLTECIGTFFSGHGVGVLRYDVSAVNA